MIGIKTNTYNKLVDKLTIKQQTVVSIPAPMTMARLPKRRASAEDTGPVRQKQYGKRLNFLLHKSSHMLRLKISTLQNLKNHKYL